LFDYYGIKGESYDLINAQQDIKDNALELDNLENRVVHPAVQQSNTSVTNAAVKCFFNNETIGTMEIEDFTGINRSGGGDNYGPLKEVTFNSINDPKTIDFTPTTSTNAMNVLNMNFTASVNSGALANPVGDHGHLEFTLKSGDIILATINSPVMT
jgi:hypothetical protein